MSSSAGTPKIIRPTSLKPFSHAWPDWSETAMDIRYLQGETQSEISMSERLGVARVFGFAYRYEGRSNDRWHFSHHQPSPCCTTFFWQPSEPHAGYASGSGLMCMIVARAEK